MASPQSSRVPPTAPVEIARLTDIANDACDSTFQSVTGYDHTSASAWNTNIINTILQRLISESSPVGQQPSYKFAVTSTILQHTALHVVNDESLNKGSQSGGGDFAGVESGGGKRGMHSASGAYWNREKDGMWNFKYEKTEVNGFDVVISIIWISTD